MARRYDVVSSLPIDSNLAFLGLPATVGTLRYVTLETWQTDGVWLINVGTINRAEVLSTGRFYELRAFVGLNFLRIKNGVVSTGHDEDGDIATWRVLDDAEILLYRYALSNYPLDPEAENGDANAIHFVENLGTHSKLIDYKRLRGEELRELDFQG